MKDNKINAAAIITGLFIFAVGVAGISAWFTNKIAEQAGLVNAPLAELPEEVVTLSEAAANACNTKGFRRFVYNERNCSIARLELKAFFESKHIDESQKKISLTETIVAAGKANNVDPDLILLLAIQESGLNPSAKSHAGAVGITQFMPATARSYGINPKNPKQSIHATGKFLASSHAKYKDWRLALACYNAGCGAVERSGGVPKIPETQNYVKSIYSRYERLKKAFNIYG